MLLSSCVVDVAKGTGLTSHEYDGEADVSDAGVSELVIASLAEKVLLLITEIDVCGSPP